MTKTAFWSDQTLFSHHLFENIHILFIVADDSHLTTITLFTEIFELSPRHLEAIGMPGYIDTPLQSRAFSLQPSDRNCKRGLVRFISRFRYPQSFEDGTIRKPTKIKETNQ